VMPSAGPQRLLAQAGNQRYLLSADELGAIRTTFESVDADGSGTIEPDELGACLQSLGLKTSLNEAKALVTRADSDGNGCLDFSEFKALMESLILKERMKDSEERKHKVGMDRDRSPLEARTSCWICESWEPVEVKWSGKATAVWLYTSLDNFERATKLNVDGHGVFTCERMLPQDQVWAILQIDNGTGLVPGLPKATLPEPANIRLRSAEGLPELEQPVASVHEVSLLELGGRRASEGGDGGVSRRPARAVLVDDPGNPGGFFVAPRITETEYRARTQRPLWSFEKSMFAAWRFENPRTYGKALGADWRLAKAQRFLKQSSDVDEVGAMLKVHYGTFLRIYRRYAACSTTGNSTFGVSMTACAELLSVAGITDDRYCRLADVDTMFIAARVREKGADKRAFAVKVGDNLLRFQFLEFLVRVAMARYHKTEEAKSAGEAINCLFAALQPHAERSLEQFREFLEAFHTEECDSVLRAKEGFLRSYYRSHAGRFNKPGEDPQMSNKEFEEVLIELSAFNDAFPARDSSYAFMLGVQLYHDEVFELDFAQMSFLEFLHGLGAAGYLRCGSMATGWGRVPAKRLASDLDQLLDGLLGPGKPSLLGLLRGLK